MAGGFLSEFMDMLFPPKCTFCKKPLKKTQTGMCPECEKVLPYTGNRFAQKGEFFSVCVSPLFYKDTVRKAVMRFKFSGKTHYARPFGALLSECIRQNLSDRYDLISWVPLSMKKLKKRGYSQAALLAMAVALALDDVAVDLLEKTMDTPAQSSLTGGAARKANVSGAYKVIDEELIRDKRILLIDDIITTGATLSECARILRNAGAKDVVCAALCRGEGD